LGYVDDDGRSYALVEREKFGGERNSWKCEPR